MAEKRSNLLCLSLTWAIDGIKWIERQAWQIEPVNKLLKSQGKSLAESIGIVLHCPGEPEWSEKDSKRVLASCTPNYDTLVHLRIHDDREYFARLANDGTLGFGETYVDEIWDGVYGGGEDISEVVKRVCENDMLDYYWTWWNRGLEWIQLQTKARSFQVKHHHSDFGNDLYKLILDPWMQYSCGFWAHADNLNDAQIHKMEVIAQKLDLKPGMRVLDIGCGWGMLCKFLAENYMVQCVGITISHDQAVYAKKTCKDLQGVDIRFQDYRELNEKFDRIVSVEMFERVPVQNHPTFFEVAHRCLNNDGIFLLHSMGRNHINLASSEPWLRKYMLPNANLPSPEDITKGTSGLFVIQDWHNFGMDYAKTLVAWRKNFIQGWPTIRSKYGDRFYRMWIYYLSACRGLFLAKRAQLWQIVLTKDGLKRDYRDVR